MSTALAIVDILGILFVIGGALMLLGGGRLAWWWFFEQPADDLMDLAEQVEEIGPERERLP